MLRYSTRRERLTVPPPYFLFTAAAIWRIRSQRAAKRSASWSRMMYLSSARLTSPVIPVTWK